MLVAAAMAAVLALRGAAAPAPRAIAEPALPPPPAAAFTVGAPVPAAGDRHRTRWARVRRDVVARAQPRARAAPVGPLDARTPEGTQEIVPALARTHGRGTWVRVRVPGLPNGRTGWVPRTALGGYGTTTARLVIDRRALTATLLRDGRVRLRAPVGIGTTTAPTPAGEYIVRDRLLRYRSPFYGPVAFGTSARGPTITDWPGGGFVGIHGTDRPDLVPGRISHGCVRLRNADILRLARLMPVGTPVTIR